LALPPGTKKLMMYRRIPDNYPEYFVISGIRPDNDSNPAGFRIVTKLDLLEKMIGKFQ